MKLNPYKYYYILADWDEKTPFRGKMLRKQKNRKIWSRKSDVISVLKAAPRRSYKAVSITGLKVVEVEVSDGMTVYKINYYDPIKQLEMFDTSQLRLDIRCIYHKAEDFIK